MTKAKKVPETSARSEEFVVESSSESEDESRLTQEKPISKKTTSTSETSSSGGDSDTNSGSHSDSAASSTSSNSHKSASHKRSAESVDLSKKPSNKKSKTKSSESSIRKHRFNPPTGYEPFQLSATDYVAETGDMFSNLNGKQVWHITAPASIPIASIESLDIPAALRGEPIFQHEGTTFNMFVGPSRGETLLIPKGADGTYSKANIEVSRSFNLRESQQSSTNGLHSGSETNGNDGNEETDSTSFVAHEQGIRRPPREQPKGLLMRYQPYGNNAPLNKPYRLSNPAMEENEVDAEPSLPNVLAIPESLSDEELVDRTRTPKKKKSKRSKVDVLSQEVGSSREDVMEIDTEDNATVQTPRSKVVMSASQTESGKKRKKDRKERA